MGIRFSCHMCNQPLHVKDFQAGKRGRCPKCQGSFRVPAKDADFSLAVEESAALAMPAKLTAKPTAKARAKPAAASQAPAKVDLSKTDQHAAARQIATGKTATGISTDTKPLANPPANEPVAMPASLLPLLDARWFVRPPGGNQYGPATTQMLLDWIAEKRVTADALLWRDGLDTWFSARELIPEPFGGESNASTKSPQDIPPPAVARPTTSSQKPVDAIAVPNVSASSVSASSVSATSKAAIAMKKKKQLKQQWMVLGLLATMALCLVIALIVILTRGA
jgi:GYF domain 2